MKTKELKCVHDHYVSRELFKARHKRWSETWLQVFAISKCSKCNQDVTGLLLYQNK
jgi:hypothetical protein